MRYKQAALSSLIMLLLLGSATGIGYLFNYMGFPETNIVIVYILSTLITARLTSGYIYGIIASVAATLTFNYFFTDPYFTLSVYDFSYIVTFFIMTITAIITSAITSRSKKNALEAKEKEAEARALYKLTNSLTDAENIEAIIQTAVSCISEVTSCNAACLCFDDGAFFQQRRQGKIARRITPSEQEMHEIRNRIINLQDYFDINEEFYDFPIYGQEKALGVIRIPVERGRTLKDKQIDILTSMIENIALAMDRLYSEQDKIKSREETEKERYRGNLLRAISHDLRTPLAGILGSSKILMDRARPEGTAKGNEEVYSIAQDIHSEAGWLHTLVENILNLTRLQDGKLLPNKEPEAAEEVVGFAVSNIQRRYPGIKIAVQVPDELLMIPMDSHLISQVFINLLDNAVKHTSQVSQRSEKECVSVCVTKENGFARFVVSDEGSGIKEEDMPNIFSLFYTSETARPDAGHGIGLGLPICEAIIKAHGGSITAQNRADRQGAEFIVTLPLE